MGLFYGKTSFYKEGDFTTPPWGISVKNKAGSRRVKETVLLSIGNPYSGKKITIREMYKYRVWLGN